MKIRLTVGKKFTLNTQNFSSVSPSIILEVVDGVKAENISEAHSKLELIADALLHDQIKSDVLTMATIKKMGFSKYFKNINQDSMDEQFESAIGGLINIDDDIPF